MINIVFVYALNSFRDFRWYLLLSVAATIQGALSCGPLAGHSAGLQQTHPTTRETTDYKQSTRLLKKHPDPRVLKIEAGRRPASTMTRGPPNSKSAYRTEACSSSNSERAGSSEACPSSFPRILSASKHARPAQAHMQFGERDTVFQSPPCFGRFRSS